MLFYITLRYRDKIDAALQNSERDKYGVLTNIQIDKYEVILHTAIDCVGERGRERERGHCFIHNLDID